MASNEQMSKIVFEFFSLCKVHWRNVDHLAITETNLLIKQDLSGNKLICYTTRKNIITMSIIVPNLQIWHSLTLEHKCAQCNVD